MRSFLSETRRAVRSFEVGSSCREGLSSSVAKWATADFATPPKPARPTILTGPVTALSSDAPAGGGGDALSRRRLNERDFSIRQLSAETIGTFWLVFGGCGSAVLTAHFPDLGIGLLGVSIAFGLTVLTMAYAVGNISGEAILVTLGLGLAGRFELRNLMPCWAKERGPGCRRSAR